MARSPVVLLLLFIAGCSGYKPRMIPDTPEVLINEGDELTFNCTSRSGFKIIFPETDSDKFINTSVHDIVHEDWAGYVHRIFRRRSAVHGDTGWYGCVDENANETDLEDPNSSWKYVYVRSDDHLFAGDNEDFEVIYAFAGNTIVLPCRPTSPELHVTLTPQPEESDDRVSFDPKIGFTMKNMKASESGLYTCTAQRGDKKAELLIYLTINKPINLLPPIISTGTSYSVTKGSELNVTCTAEVGTGPYMISWTSPKKNAAQKVYNLPTHIIDVDKRLATSVLNIQNARGDDEGVYVCQVDVHNASAKTQTYIHVLGPNERSINLISPHHK